LTSEPSPNAFMTNLFFKKHILNENIKNEKKKSTNQQINKSTNQQINKSTNQQRNKR